MKNKILFSVLALLFLAKANAQLSVSATATCATATLTATVNGMVPIDAGIVADDAWSSVIPIGFTFNFYGTPNTQCLIGSNGEIGFSLGSAGGFEAYTITTSLQASAAGNGSRICGTWCDMYLPAGGNIKYATVGTAPNRKFVVDFCSVALYTCTTLIESSQIILYETTNIIEVHIKNKGNCPSWNSGYAIVGVVNDTSAATTAPGRDFPSVWSAADEAWRFTPVGSTSYTVASTPYSPVPYASALIAWYDSTSGTLLGGTSPLTVSPSGPTTYKCIALSCNDSLVSYIHVIPSSTINGVDSVCVGSNITLTDTTTGGTWSSSFSSIATVTSGGVVHGVAAGVDTIYYTLGTCVAKKIITVNPIPSVAAITGLSTVCTGNTITLGETTVGVTWASSNSAVATVSSSGLVTGVSVGTVIITCVYSNPCGTASATKSITVNPFPSVAAITGLNFLCAGTNITLADATSGGTWSSSGATATVTGTGVVHGVSAGTDTIKYAITNTCGTATATLVITINAAPSAGVISGPSAVCTGSIITLVDAASGGSWSASNGTATVVGGNVTGVSIGTDTISYSVSNSCGTSVATYVVTTTSGPAAITPVGAINICLSTTTTLADVTSGGTWSSSASGTASVSSSGVVTGNAIGSATISYAIGSCYVTKLVNVITGPLAISPTSAAICSGSTTTFTDGTIGGTWSSTAVGVATVAGGVVTGVASGVATISYALGGCAVTATVTVNPVPVTGSIAGPTGICGSGTITLTDGVAGGTWSASNGTATINTSGVVTAISNGTDTISYTVSNTCGSASATYTISVVSTTSVQAVTGPPVICAGSFAIYSDSTVGGVWSMSNANATVTGTGVVTGITSGTDIITYTYTNACGTATATKTITITTLPTITPITGLTTVCAGATITLADATASGTWSRTNTKATVSGTGVVTGITTGIDTIIYSVSNSCGIVRDSIDVTINTIPSPGVITGANSVCVGSIGTYTESVAGGVWTITNANASIVSALGDGIVTGAILGLDTIKYTVTTACGTSAITKPITINPYPVAGVISGPLAVCIGSAITLSETMPGGVWTSGNTALATVSGTGVVTGVSTGTDTISYTISGGCAVVGTWATIDITALPSTGTITGPTAVCIGSTIALADAVSGGTWINGSSHGSISSTGLFTGLTHGTDLVSYALTNMCGTGYATSLITVDTFPTAGFISWTDGVCVGSAVTLIDTTPGGIWVASNGNAMILAPGIIWGVSPGIDTIFYIVTNSCGTADAIKILPVNALTVVAAITGSSEICVGSITSLADATSGGVWASSNSSIATIDIETGLVDGVSPGVVTITYTVTNSLGCPSSATLSLTVDAIPVIPAVTGITHQCVGTNTTLTDATVGGTWSSSNTAIATIDATGMVSGVTAGIVTITYTVTNICGTTNITKADTVNALPTIAPIISATSECVGANATLTDATPSGVWNSTDTTIATINTTTGVVTGVAAGTVNINYTVTNTHGCSATTSISNTVNPLPVVLPITGTTNECLTNTAMLADATVGGTWSSSNTTIASIDATGLVTGNAGGIVTISYSTTNTFGCVGAATTNDTVNTVPVATTITGTMHVCIGATTTLADASLWGVWSSATPSTATINAANGVITGVAAGTDIINYTVTNPCGMVIDTALITVYALPTVSPITGATTTICAGASTVLSDATTGGAWSSSNTAIATVNSTTGLVTGVAAGADTIIYTLTNSNGCSISTTYPLNFGSYLGTSSVAPSSGTICGGHAVYMHVVTSAGGLTYQWLRNGVAIAGATNYNYTTDSTGSYSVIIGNGVCEETLTGTTVTLMTTAVINFTAPNMLYTGSYASYQWYRNGIAIPGATNSLYFETLPGNYSVAVTDVNGCSQTTNSYTIHGSGSSAVSIVGNNEDIRIYPNPATSMLFVDAPQPVNITIICADGRKVIEQPNTQSVNVSTLADGMYIIMLYNADGLLLKTDKFVKRN